jgi:hypothetical protein
MSYCSESVQLYSKATSILSKGLTKGTRNLSKNKESQREKHTSPEATRDANIQHFYFKIMSYVHQKHRDHLRNKDPVVTQFSVVIDLVTDMGMRSVFEKDLEGANAVLEKLRASCTEQGYAIATWQDSGSLLKPFCIRVASFVLTPSPNTA